MGRVRVAVIAAIVAVPSFSATAAMRPSSPEIRRVSLPGIGAVDLVLERNELLAPNAHTTLTDEHGRTSIVAPPPVHAWRGHVRGDRASVVRLTSSGGSSSGLILVERAAFELNRSGWRRVEPFPPSGAPFGVVSAVAGEEEDDPIPSQRVGIGLLNCSLVPCGSLTAQIVLDADVFFYERDPKTCFSRQLASLNLVEGIFAHADIDVRFQVTQQNCRTAPDLGARGTDVAAYHEDFKAWWDEQGSDRSIAHLFVGYDFDGRVLGRTYAPAICARIQPDPLVKGPPEQRCPFGYSLSQSVPDPDGGFTASVFHTTKLLANIFGYAFGGSADHAEGCGPERTGTILCSPIQWNGPNEYSEANRSRIRAHAEQKLGYLVRVPS